MASRRGNQTCGRLNIMGSIVSDASPYLFPLMIEYSLIGATVLFVMWRNIGRRPRYLHPDGGHRTDAGHPLHPPAGKVSRAVLSADTSPHIPPRWGGTA